MKPKNQLEIKTLFHTLWTKAAVNDKDYNKKEWQRLVELLRHHNIEVQ
jgi:N-dimethylarginine dimethylaminohydrolase